MQYDSQEALAEARIVLQELMDKYDDSDKEHWFHLGSRNSAKALGLKSLHDLTHELEHRGFGFFRSNGYFYDRKADTNAGRIYHRRMNPVVAN